MAKASQTTVETSPSLAEIHAAAQSVGNSSAIQSNAKSVNARALADKLAKKEGVKVEFAGGSLPMLTFSQVGEAHFLRFTGEKTVPGEKEGDEFQVCNFDILDSDTYPAEIKVIAQASLTKAATLEDAMRDIKKGDCLIITYHGRGTAKKGFSPPHLYSVDKVG